MAKVPKRPWRPEAVFAAMVMGCAVGVACDLIANRHLSLPADSYKLTTLPFFAGLLVTGWWARNLGVDWFRPGRDEPSYPEIPRWRHVFIRGVLSYGLLVYCIAWASAAEGEELSLGKLAWGLVMGIGGELFVGYERAVKQDAEALAAMHRSPRGSGA